MLNRRVFDKIFTEFRGILEIERKFFVFVGILENKRGVAAMGFKETITVEQFLS